MTVAARAPWAVRADLLPEAALPVGWDRGTSGLTASGVPVEVSLSASPDTGRLQHRVVVDPGAGHPPESKVAAGLNAASNIGRLLDPPGGAVAADLATGLTLCAWDGPVPWAVWVGAATASQNTVTASPNTVTASPEIVSAKVYARLTERAALQQLAAGQGAATTALRRVLAALPRDLPVDWRFAGWDVASDGSVSAKVYLTARPGQEHAVLSWVARPWGVDAGAALDALGCHGLDRALWTGGMILAAGWSGNGWRLGVHASPPVDQTERWRRARALGRSAGIAGWDAALDDLAGPAEPRLDVSWMALGLVPPGRVQRVTVYLAPR